MNRFRRRTAAVLAMALSTATMTRAANHREAPITALDHKADITDWYAFVSYDNPTRVTLIMAVDPLLEPGNGPNYFPFDSDVLYSLKIDNNHDAIEDVVFEFRFKTEQRLPGVFTALVGKEDGVFAPENSPPPVPPGTLIVPPAITALEGPGSEGLGVRQSYTVTMRRRGQTTLLSAGRRLFAVPSNVGPRTMPDYASLAAQGVYTLRTTIPHTDRVRVFAGTTDDAFWIDLGAFFDTANLRRDGFPVPGVLSDKQDADDTQNFAADEVSGFNVNTIAIEVPIQLLTSDGLLHPETDPRAVIGTWGTTSREQVTIRRSPDPALTLGPWRQVQRMGNPLINELLIGTGSKDRFSMDRPSRDSQFASFFLDPLLARVLNALYEDEFGAGVLPIPTPPRTDLLPLVTYAPPIAPIGTPSGPVADLLRLNTGIPPTPLEHRRRLGFIVGDRAGFPNGRRVSDDVTDIASRAVVGILHSPPFQGFPHNRIGDGVNANDAAYLETFPYVGYAHDGRNSRHVDPGEPGGGPIP